METFRSQRGAAIAFVRSGSGTPVLALHGAYSTHHEIRAIVEPVFAEREYRVIFPDLPGMGESTAEGVGSAEEVLDVLDELIAAEFGDERMLVIGQSFGAHIARGLAARHPDRVLGLVLICPLMTGPLEADRATVVRDDPGAADGLDPALRSEFEGYFVVRTAATAARFAQAVAPAIGRFDAEAVERIMNSAEFRTDPAAVRLEAPALIVTARHDSFVGHVRQQELVEFYPRATATVVADAGHALPHERPELLEALMADLLDRLQHVSGPADDRVEPR